MSRMENIRDFSGRIIGIYEFMDNGDIAIREWPSQKILGFYRKAYDHTTNFAGRVLTKGNTLAMLLNMK